MNISDSEVPQLALGTWLMGGTKEPDPNNDDEKDISVIQLAIDEGITLIDTAQNYANGKCEEIVGKAIEKYPRTSYQILAKQNKNFLSYDNVIEGCHASMRRMNIEYIDYFVCHAPNTDFDMHDFFKATNQLYKDGFIKNVGVSNFGPNLLKLAIETSEVPVRFNQVHFSIDDDDILTTGTYDFCIKNNISIQAYRPLVSIDENEDATEVLATLGKKYNLTKHQIVLAYLKSYEGVVFTVRASTKKHWDEIKAAMHIELESEDISEIYNTHKNKKGNFGEFLLV